MTKGHKGQNTQKSFLNRKETGMGPLYRYKIALGRGPMKIFPLSPSLGQLFPSLVPFPGFLIDYLILCSLPTPTPICGWPVSFQGVSYLHTQPPSSYPCAEITHAHYLVQLYVGSGDSNLGLHACAASILPQATSPALFFGFLCVWSLCYVCCVLRRDGIKKTQVPTAMPQAPSVWGSDDRKGFENFIQWGAQNHGDSKGQGKHLANCSPKLVWLKGRYGGPHAI